MSDSSIHRLAGSSRQGGGLIIKKKKTPKPEEDGNVFKVPQPRTSLLGLDLLAKQKRKEKAADEDEEKRKRSKVTSYKDDWDKADDVEADEEEDGERKKNGMERHYRSPRIETPSDTGGVSDAARDKQRRRERDNRTGGVYASSSKDRDRRDRDRADRYRDRDRDRDRRRDRDSERRRNRDSERGNRSSSSERSDWERTPRASDEPATLRISRGITTPSRSSWDEDELSTKKSSTWDLPTPSRLSRDGDRSERGHGSQRSERAESGYYSSSKK